MATLCRAYPSEAAARRAIAGLRAAGLPPQGAHLITGSPLHDLRRETAGGFAGKPDRQREGSFADVDRHVIVHCDPDGREHTHVAGLHELEALLAGAGLERAAAERALAEHRAGSSL